MAKKKNNQPNPKFNRNLLSAAQQPLRAQESANANDRQPKPESVQITEKVAAQTNQKVMQLIGGIAKLRQFQEEHAEEDKGEFFEANEEKIGALLNLNLQETYQKLVANSDGRTRLYGQMLQRGVLTQPEMDLFLGKVSNQPYFQAIAAIKPTPPSTEKLTDDDVDNLRHATIDNIQIICDRLKTENKLTDAEIARLIDLGPKTPEQIAEARRQISIKIQQFDIANTASFSTQFTNSIREENQLNGQIDGYVDQYNEILKNLTEQIQEMYDNDQAEQLKNEKIRALCKDTGLPIRKGAILYGEDWSIDPTNTTLERPRNNRIEILDVTFGSADEDADVYPEFKVKSLSFDPIIHFTALAQDGSGRTLDYQMSTTSFRKWLVANNVSEQIENIAQLEKNLGMEGFLKAGQTFEYQVGESEEMETHQVKITTIGPDYIELDQPVVLDQADPRSGLLVDRKAQKMSFGDFARWYKKLHTVPEVHKLEELDRVLVNHHRILNEEMNWKPETGTPINLSNSSKPLLLISAYDPDTKNFFEITDATDEKITFASGEKMTPTEFLHFANNNGLMIPSPEMLQELHDIAANKQDAGEQAKMAEYMNKYNLPVTEISGEKSSKTAEKKAAVPHDGYFKSLWKNIHFLSLMDMYELLIKAPADRIKEYMKDKSERKQYAVGKDLWKGTPFLGLGDLSNSYEDKMNGKIAKDVKDAEEFYDKNYTIAQVFEKLYTAPNRVILKAALQFLSKKGVLRWEDDPKLWAIVNLRLGGVPYPKKFEPLVGGANVPVVVGQIFESAEPTIFNQARILMDKAWGDGAGDSINNANERQYQTEKDDTAKNMRKKYEFYGGIEFNLKKMLNDFQNGLDVSEAEFDGLLSEAMAELEVNLQQGILLFITAFGMRREKHPQTLLSFSRMEAYINKMKDHQVFVYFAVGHDLRDENGKIIIDPKTGKPKRAKLSLNNFQYLYNTVVKKDMKLAEEKGLTGLELFTADKNTINWIQSEILIHPRMKEKATKMAGNANIDVGLYHYLGPLMYQEPDLDKILGSGYGSLQKPEIIKNMYAGYDNQLKVRVRNFSNASASGRKERAKELSQMCFSFLYFNHVVRGKIKSKERYMRLSPEQYNDEPYADKIRKVSEFADETEEFMRQFALGLGDLSGDNELKTLTQQVLFSPTKEIDEDLESEFRNKLSFTIRELAETKPAELAALATEKAEIMKGMSGAAFSKEEIEKKTEAAA